MLLWAPSVPIDDSDNDHLGRDGQHCDSRSEDSNCWSSEVVQSLGANQIQAHFQQGKEHNGTKGNPIQGLYLVEVSE